jgi:chromosome segregation ATPase
VSRAARLADRLRHAQAVAAEARASRDSVVTQLNDANSTITRLQEALTKSAAEDTRLMDAAWEIEKRARRAEDALRQTIKERDDARAANARQL